MKLVPFSILTVLSLVFAGLTVMESALYQTWERTTAEQKLIQMKLTHFQRLDAFAETLLRRLAVESQNDPGLAEILRQRHIRVVVRTADSTKVVPGTVTPPATLDKSAQAPPGSTPVTPDKPAPIAPSSTPSHP